MRSIVSAIALILAAVALGAAGLVDPVKLVGHSAAERTVLLSDLYLNRLPHLHPDTLLHYEQAMRAVALEHNDADLVREADLLRAHFFYRFSERFPPERVLPVLDSLVAEAEHDQVPWLRIRAESLLAYYNFHTLHRYEQGFAHYSRLAELLRGVTTAEMPTKAIMLHDIAMAHYMFRDYAQASVFFKLAIDAGSVEGLPAWSTTFLNDIGLCYREMGDLDSADLYFNRAREIARSLNNDAWVGITTGNLGHDLYMRGRYAEAIPLMEIDLANARKINDDGLAAGALITLGDIALKQDETARARGYLDEALALVRSSGQYQRFARLYPLLAKLNASTGDHERAGAYIDSAMFVRDSLDRAFNVLKFTRIEQKLAAERQQARETEIHLMGEAQVMRRNGIIIALSLGMVIALIVLNRHRHSAKLKQAAAAERERHAQAELLSATERLEDFRRSFQEKSAMLEVATEEVTRLRESTPVPEPENPDRDIHLKNLQKSVLLTDGDWVEFSALFERVHAGFFTRLAEKMPGLTPAETRFMALSRLGMNGREMAAMLGVGTDAIRQVRHRVRRKADMGEDATMEQVAATI